jgi:hypothetical protein
LKFFGKDWDLGTLFCTNGYKIEFCTEPFQIHPRITLVPKLLEKREIIQKEVNSLLENGAIRPVQEIQGEFISTIFLVSKKTNMHLLIPNWSENRPSELKPELSAKFPS